MPKPIQLEKVTGVVAMSYLVLIPVGAYVLWQKVKIIDRDINVIWEKLDLPESEPTTTIVNLDNFKNLIRGRRHY
jgi:hypothetical protein